MLVRECGDDSNSGGAGVAIIIFCVRDDGVASAPEIIMVPNSTVLCSVGMGCKLFCCLPFLFSTELVPQLQVVFFMKPTVHSPHGHFC